MAIYFVLSAGFRATWQYSTVVYGYLCSEPTAKQLSLTAITLVTIIWSTIGNLCTFS